jgi:hypothetical protein
MIICAKCKKEMTCKITGSNVRFMNGHHVYAADQYECKHCGAIVNVTVLTPFFDKGPIKNDRDVWMDS